MYSGFLKSTALNTNISPSTINSILNQITQFPTFFRYGCLHKVTYGYSFTLNV